MSHKNVHPLVTRYVTGTSSIRPDPVRYVNSQTNGHSVRPRRAPVPYNIVLLNFLGEKVTCTKRQMVRRPPVHLYDAEGFSRQKDVSVDFRRTVKSG